MDPSDAIDAALAGIDSDFVKALTEPARIEILKQLILFGASDVKSLSERMPQDRSVISRHLALMERAGILKSRKEGRHVVYQVDADGTLHKAEQLVETIRLCIKNGCC